MLEAIENCRTALNLHLSEMILDEQKPKKVIMLY